MLATVDRSPEFREAYDESLMGRVPWVAGGLVPLHLLQLVVFGSASFTDPSEKTWRAGVLTLHAAQGTLTLCLALWAAVVWPRHRSAFAARWLLLAIGVSYLTFGTLLSGVDQLRDLSIIAMLSAYVGVALLLDAGAVTAALLFGTATAIGVGLILRLQDDEDRRLAEAVQAVASGVLAYLVNLVTAHWRRQSWTRQHAAETLAAELGVLNQRLREEVARRAEAEAELAALAMRDPLTDLPNRRFFLASLSTARAASPETALLLLDLDDFRAVNTALGHPAGDEVLRRVSAVLLAAVRTDDVVARLGGEEFAAILPRAPAAEASRLAERLRSSIEQAGLGRADAPLTVSIGVCSARPEDTADDLLRRADAALYRAKDEGKNRVSVAG